MLKPNPPSFTLLFHIGKKEGTKEGRKEGRKKKERKKPPEVKAKALTLPLESSSYNFTDI